MSNTPIIYNISAPKALQATVELPASKSISNRALVINALASRGNATAPSLEASPSLSQAGVANSERAFEREQRHFLPQNLSDCDDTAVMVRALRDMPAVIDIGAAGTAMRFMTAYLAVTPGEHVITGTERMKHRPIGILVDALRRLGADIAYEGEEGFPPLRVKGQPLNGGSIEIPGDMSSQYISALLMIAPTLKDGLELRLKGAVISRPYIDLTLWMMREFGAEADWTSGNTVAVRPTPYRQRVYSIENDWSAASYWYEMMALTGDADAELRLPGLTDGSKQGDSAVRYIFSMLGVRTTFGTLPAANNLHGALLRKNNRSVSRLDYDFTNSPDLAQTLVATCAALGTRFHFRGLQTLKIKETDRIEALKRELRKLGIVITDRNDAELIWDGQRCEPTFEPIDTYDDHRMALAFAPLALVFPKISIRNPHVVTKSYPHFWSVLSRSGFSVETAEEP